MEKYGKFLYRQGISAYVRGTEGDTYHYINSGIIIRANNVRDGKNIEVAKIIASLAATELPCVLTANETHHNQTQQSAIIAALHEEGYTAVATLGAKKKQKRI